MFKYKPVLLLSTMSLLSTMICGAIVAEEANTENVGMTDSTVIE